MTKLTQGSSLAAGIAAAVVALSAATGALGNQAGGAAPAGDAAPAATGSQLFRDNCAECHTLSKEGHQMNGPNLWGVFGAKAGSKPDFPYSDALKISDIVWSDETMDKWLASPPALVPDNMMGFIGLPRREDREAVVAFLKQRTAAE